MLVWCRGYIFHSCAYLSIAIPSHFLSGERFSFSCRSGWLTEWNDRCMGRWMARLFSTTLLLRLVLACRVFSFALFCPMPKLRETWKCCYLCHCFVYLFSSALKRYIYIHIHTHSIHICLSSVSISWYHTMNKKSKRLMRLLMLPPVLLLRWWWWWWCSSETHNLVIEFDGTFNTFLFLFISTLEFRMMNTHRRRWKLPKTNEYTQCSFVYPLHHHHHRYIYLWHSYMMIVLSKQRKQMTMTEKKCRCTFLGSFLFCFHFFVFFISHSFNC